MKKLNAFTIIELCIVMLLSAIVTGIAFFTLEIFQGSVRRFKHDSQSISDLILLHRMIQQDIWYCIEMEKSSEGILTKGQKGVSKYHFNPDFVIREKNARSDTFHFRLENITTQFQKQSIDIQGQLIDEISFDLLYKGETHPFYFYKTYAADVLMQHTSTTF